MKILRHDREPDGFFRALADAPSRVLLLDYDGTLAPFREERDQAVPYPGLREAVSDHLSMGGTRVVVVSGRAVRDLRPLLGVEPPPELWGSHGWERYLPGDGLSLTDPGEGIPGVLEEARQKAVERATGQRTEVKPVSVAVHVRGMDEGAASDLLEDMRTAWEPLARDHALELHAFDGGLELRVPGRDKGTAVREILAGEPEEAAVAYLGDDLTDEDAFRVLGERPGPTLRVLVRPEIRETEADLWIEPPDELVTFLERWKAAAAGREDTGTSERLPG